MRRRLALLVLGLGLVTSSAVLASGALSAAPCEGYEVRPMLGPSCPVPGGYEVELSTGHRVVTHGLDAAPSLLDPLPAQPRLVGLLYWPVVVPPACAQPGDARGVIIYAHPPGVDRYDAKVGEIRRMFDEANNRLFYRGLDLGMPARYKMECEDLDTVKVHKVEVAGGPSFWNVAGAVASRGFNQPSEKYWVWYDGCFCGGVGSLYYDDRGFEGNYNNGGPSWGLTYGHEGEFGSLVMMHENGHNLGAVQLSSPESSGGFHCNDGFDIMCYADGGSTANYRIVCPGHPTYGPRGSQWDCNADDYFHPNPAPGSYLSSHWNLGAPYVRFLQRGV